MIQDDIGQLQRNVAANVNHPEGSPGSWCARLDQKCPFIHSHAVR
jgi:hypothetical protein